MAGRTAHWSAKLPFARQVGKIGAAKKLAFSCPVRDIRQVGDALRLRVIVKPGIGHTPILQLRNPYLVQLPCGVIHVALHSSEEPRLRMPMSVWKNAF
jgi:hypothetical protein